MERPPPRGVLLAVMDSARPPTLALLPVATLSARARLGRALKRMLVPWAFIPLVIFIPLLHLVAPLLLLLLGPVLGVKAWGQTVLIAPGPVPCPKCAQLTPLDEATPGWPARLHCGLCGSTFFATPAPGGPPPGAPPS